MKKATFIGAALACTLLAASCGVLTLPASTESTTTTTTSSSSSSTDSATSILGSILGSFGLGTTANTIVGTWTYQEPAVQFTSDNLLAKAGGSVASAKVVKQIEPYYKKVGITKGTVVLTLNEDKTCTYTLKGKTYSGTYEFDNSANTLQIKGTAFNFPLAYVSVAGSQLALTFDSSKLLSIVQGAGSLASGNSTLSSISQIAQMYDGMKTGFLFTK